MKKKARNSIRSWLTIGISSLVMLTPFAGLTYIQATQVEKDSRDCLVSGKPHRLLLVLIDQSDPFDAVDREKVISAAVGERLNRLEQYDQVAVMTLNAEVPSKPVVLFQKCAPKNPLQGDSLLDRLLNPPDATKKQWAAFQIELNAAIRRALQEDEQATTPLLETLIAVAKDPDQERAQERTFLIFSDMIQNTRWLNFYKAIPRISSARELGIPVETGFFGATSIYIHHITRYQQGNGRPRTQRPSFRRQVKEFWNAWLQDQGAHVFWSEHLGEQGWDLLSREGSTR